MKFLCGESAKSMLAMFRAVETLSPDEEDKCIVCDCIDVFYTFGIIMFAELVTI